MIAEEKLIHVETPGSYQQVALSEFCITPSEHQTLKFDVKAGSDAITQLFTDSGTSGFSYQIVIGGNANRVAILRRGSPGLGDKQYISVGLYKTSIRTYVFLFWGINTLHLHIDNVLIVLFSDKTGKKSRNI